MEFSQSVSQLVLHECKTYSKGIVVLFNNSIRIPQARFLNGCAQSNIRINFPNIILKSSPTISK